MWQGGDSKANDPRRLLRPVREGGCMSQSRKHSMLEAWSQTIIGYFINLIVQIIVYPWFGATFTFTQNVLIGLIFMVVSIARGYALRRWWNRKVA
jgi:hypothetical protein